MVSFFLDSVGFFLWCIGYKNIVRLSVFFRFICFNVLSIRKEVILRNLDIAYGDSISLKRKQKIAEKSFENFALLILEFFVLEKLAKKLKITIKHTEFTKKFDFQNNPVYFLCIHQGNWELLASKAMKLHLVVKPVGSPSVNKWVNQKRKALGFGVIERQERKAVFQIFEFIKKRKSVAFVVDQRRGTEYPIPFFSRPAYTNVGLIKIYERCPAPVIPISIRRKGLYHHEVVFYENLEFISSASKDEACLKENALKMNQTVEKMVLDSPGEYFWLHRRWKGFEN